MYKPNKGFITIPMVLLVLLITGGITAGVVVYEQNKTDKIDMTIIKEDRSDQSVYTEPRELLAEGAPAIKPDGFNCNKDLCVESGTLNVGIYQTEYRVDVAEYKITNGTDKKIYIDKLIFTHPGSYTFNGLLSLNFALNVNSDQVGSAPAFINRGDYYELAFIKGNGQFDSFAMAPYETVTLWLKNSVSPFSTGGQVEIFLSEIEGRDNIKYSGHISGGKIPVSDIISKTDCQEKFGKMKNPSTGKTQPIRVHLISPNSGKYDQGDSLTIKWETCDLPEDGQLFRAYLNGQIIVSGGPEAVNDGIQIIKIPNNLPDGEYVLSIEVLDMYNGGGDYITFDDSDGLITVGSGEQENDEPEEEEENEPSENGEASAKGGMSSFRAAAEITFDQNNGSYNGVCDSGNIAYNLLEKARQDIGMYKTYDCKENGLSYRVWLEMISTTEVYCVDNTGHNDLVSKSSINSSNYSCLQ
jgi:hypothetical protein